MKKQYSLKPWKTWDWKGFGIRISKFWSNTWNANRFKIVMGPLTIELEFPLDLNWSKIEHEKITRASGTRVVSGEERVII